MVATGCDSLHVREHVARLWLQVAITPTAHIAGFRERARVVATGCDSEHVARRRGAGCCAIAELAIVVASPATHTTSLEERTSVRRASGDGTNAGQHITRGRRRSPAVHGPGLHDGAGMVAPSRNCVHSRAHIARWRCTARLPKVGVGRAIVVGRAAELAKTVVAPAADCTRVHQRARVSVASRNGLYTREHAARRVRAIRQDTAIAQLARCVRTPTDHATRFRQRARMIAAGRNSLYPREHVARWWCRPGGCGAVAELARAVATPAANTTRVHERARVSVASRDGLYNREHVICRQRRARAYGAVAELARIVATPTAHPAVRHQRAGVIVASCERDDPQGVSTATERRLTCASGSTHTPDRRRAT